MSASNPIQFHQCVVYQTLEQRADNTQVLSDNGIEAVHIENGKVSQRQYLGTGTYLWENNFGAAVDWGIKRYATRSKKFCIYEAEIKLNKEYFLDLVGDTDDMQTIPYLKDLLIKNDFENDVDSWTLGRVIEAAKKMGIFEHKYIRVADHNIIGKQSSSSIILKEGKDAFINLQPQLIICLIEKDDIFLRDFSKVDQKLIDKEIARRNLQTTGKSTKNYTKRK